MKIKATQKEIKNGAKKLYAVSYCAIQTLLRFEQPFAYSAGVYGWNCDYYDFNGIVISTGYRPIGQHVDYDIAKRYEDKAQKIFYGNFTDYKTSEKKINVLLKKFLQEIQK